MKKLFTFALMLILLVSLSVTALGAGAVTYDGNAQEFIFEPGSDYSPTDLFENFKDVMPGDSLTETITVKGHSSSDVRVELYMRSLGAKEGSEDFLSQLTLTVTQDGNALFDAPADQTAQLTDWVHLGTFYPSTEVVLNVTLNVPIEMGNEFQDTAGYLDWQFKAEEIPVSDDNPPSTGDNSNMTIYIVAAAACVVIIIVLLVLTKKKKK